MHQRIEPILVHFIPSYIAIGFYRDLSRSMRPDELNQQCFEQLEKAGVGQGRYIAVVGAGPSSPLIPASNQLMKEMAHACGIISDDQKPFWEFFEEARTQNPSEYCKVITERFEDKPFLRIETYKHIVSGPFKSFITLNYDHHLPAAFSDKFGGNWQELFSVYPMRSPVNGRSSALASAVDLGGHKKRLVAVHGYRDHSDPSWPTSKIVLTRSDYDKHYCSYETGTYLANWWKDVLAIHDCLFIGTSLREPGLNFVMDYLIKDGNPEFLKRKHLHLKDVSLIRKKVSDTDFIDIYPPIEKLFGGISQLQFDPKENFSGLIDILSRFSGFTSTTDFEPGMTGIGSMFPTFSSFQ